MQRNGKGAGPETGAPCDAFGGGRKGTDTPNRRDGQRLRLVPRPSAHDVAAAMLEAMRAAGIHPRDPGAVLAGLLAGGRVRFHCDGDGKGKRNGFAELFLDGRPAGYFGNWRLGSDSHSWRAGDALAPPSRPDRAAIAARQAQEREARESRYREAESEARRLLQASGAPRADHPYLVAKRLDLAAAEAMGRQIVVRQLGPDLLIPLETLATRWCNLQRIRPDGSKRFLPGGRLEGAFWCAGRLEGAPVIAIGEGWATMAAVHLASGLPVAAAMSAGNLEAVALALHGRHPAARLILCADMDTGPHGNIGLAKANAAAAAVPGALVAVPPRPAVWHAEKGHDFADTFKAPGGPEAIRHALGLER